MKLKKKCSQSVSDRKEKYKNFSLSEKIKSFSNLNSLYDINNISVKKFPIESRTLPQFPPTFRDMVIENNMNTTNNESNIINFYT